MNRKGTGGTRWFRLALGAALASICLSAYLMARAQSGPSWEVPAAVMQELRTLPPLALGLAIAAASTYFWASRFRNVNQRARRAFAIVLLIALALPITIWLSQPEQWPFRFVTLSFLATLIVIPIWLASALLLWLIGWRWAKQA